MSDAVKLDEVKKAVAALSEPAAPVEEKPAEPIAAPVADALGLEQKPEVKNAGYVDTSKLAPKKEGYSADTDNKKFFDFIQDRYRAGSLGVAPGYNFYSDSPLYNDKLVEEYKTRYPELAEEYAKQADAAQYQKVLNPSTENKHELAGFWDYAAGRQEKDDLRNLYMYGFKSDDPRANPEIMQRLKDENPWLWEEYQKSLADADPVATAEGDKTKPVGDEAKPEPITEMPEDKKKVGDWMSGLLNAGYSLIEILQAAAAGRAGITDINQTMYGRRVASENEQKKLEDERAFQEKLAKIQNDYQVGQLKQSQEFQAIQNDKNLAADEKNAIAQRAHELVLKGMDKDTAIQLAYIQKDAAVSAAGLKAGTDPLALKELLTGGASLDQLFESGQISKEDYAQLKNAGVSGTPEQKGGTMAGNGTKVPETMTPMGQAPGADALYKKDLENEAKAKAEAAKKQELMNMLKTAQASNPMAGQTKPNLQPAEYQKQVQSLPNLATKQQWLTANGFKPKNAQAGIWEKVQGAGLPPIVITGVM